MSNDFMTAWREANEPATAAINAPATPIQDKFTAVAVSNNIKLDEYRYYNDKAMTFKGLCARTRDEIEAVKIWPTLKPVAYINNQPFQQRFWNLGGNKWVNTWYEDIWHKDDRYSKYFCDWSKEATKAYLRVEEEFMNCPVALPKGGVQIFW